MCADNTARRVVSGDLCHLDQGTVASLNGLYASGGFSFQDNEWRWRYVSESTVDYWVRLDSGSDQLWLGIVAALPPDDIDFDWREYNGDVQRIAWAATHATILELAQQLFQRDWIPGNILFGNAPTNSMVDAGFDITLLSTVSAHGCCRFRPQLLPPTSTNLPREITSPADQLQIAVPIIVDSAWICIEELMSVEIGAVFFIRRRAFLDIGARATLQIGVWKILAKVSGSKIVVIDVRRMAPDEFYQKGKSMTSKESSVEENNSGEEVAGCNPEFEPVEIGSLPVQVHFEAGRISTSYSELRVLQPGFTFELGRPLDEQTIAIRANGALIARGELVAVGDQLGVRVTALCGNLRVTQG